MEGNNLYGANQRSEVISKIFQDHAALHLYSKQLEPYGCHAMIMAKHSHDQFMMTAMFLDLVAMIPGMIIV